MNTVRYFYFILHRSINRVKLTDIQTHAALVCSCLSDVSFFSLDFLLHKEKTAGAMTSTEKAGSHHDHKQTPVVFPSAEWGDVALWYLTAASCDPAAAGLSCRQSALM